MLEEKPANNVNEQAAKPNILKLVHTALDFYLHFFELKG